MARTPSNMLPLGTKAPYFELLDTISGRKKNLNEIKGTKATVIFFICNHCPFVKHVNKELVRVSNDYMNKGVSFIGICSNDAEQYPDDAPELMTKTAKQENYPFPYLYDETQKVAREYDAACTPDFYIFDKDDKLVYRGQLDDSRPDNGIEVTGADLRNAIEAILNGKEVNPKQKPSLGCNIKWKE